MAGKTFVRIVSEDAQGREGSFEWRVPDADYGDTTLPLSADIVDVIGALYGSAKLANQRVKYVETILRDESFAGGGGEGNSPTSQALRLRSNESVSEFLLRIPGMNLSEVAFDPQNRNAVSTIGTLWTALREALGADSVAISAPTGSYVALTDDKIAQHASAFDGRRGLIRPR